MTKVVLQGYILVSDSDLEMVKDELVVHTKLTMEESGCLLFKVTLDENIPNKFIVYEEFVNQSAFDKHQLRIKNSNWGKVSKRVERHYKISNSVLNQ